MLFRSLVLTVLLLALAGALTGFNAWQLAGGPPASPATGSSPGGEPPAAEAPQTRDGWKPGPTRKARTDPVPETLLRREARRAPEPPSAPSPRPARPEPAPAASTPREPSASPLMPPRVPRVSAILWTAERPLAVVDGEVVALGESVGGLRVRRIGRRVVYLVSPDGKAAVAVPLNGSREGTSR